MKVFLGISGASGQPYAGRLLKALAGSGSEVTACFSSGAVEVIRAEETLPLDRDALASAGREDIISLFLDRYGVGGGAIELAAPDEMGSAFASGSSLASAAVVCPCSMSTLGSIAAGITRNLTHRVADVMLKEGRPLVLVPRETPLSEIHLRNLLSVSRAGARIVPAMPAFYGRPQTIDDLLDFVAGKVLDCIGIKHDLYHRWQGC